MSTERQKPEVRDVRPEDVAWGKSYEMSTETKPSWSKHGMPALFPRFMEFVKDSKVKGKHIDLGCGDGTKTVVFAEQGLDTIGFDISDEGFEEFELNVKTQGMEGRCKFELADCTNISLPDGVAASASDILMSTHLKEDLFKKYVDSLARVLKDGGYVLIVAFSDKDKHFHGHPVSERYDFHWTDSDPNLEPELDKYRHYENMHNHHYNEEGVRRDFGLGFEIVDLVEIPHPNYPHRQLLNIILQKKAGNGRVGA